MNNQDNNESEISKQNVQGQPAESGAADENKNSNELDQNSNTQRDSDWSAPSCSASSEQGQASDLTGLSDEEIQAYVEERSKHFVPMGSSHLSERNVTINLPNGEQVVFPVDQLSNLIVNLWGVAFRLREKQPVLLGPAEELFVWEPRMPSEPPSQT